MAENDSFCKSPISFIKEVWRQLWVIHGSHEATSTWHTGSWSGSFSFAQSLPTQTSGSFPFLQSALKT